MEKISKYSHDNIQENSELSQSEAIVSSLYQVVKDLFLNVHQFNRLNVMPFQVGKQRHFFSFSPNCLKETNSC